LAGFRASVERAEAAGGGLALDVARAQLAVAQEFQAAGKDPRHHAAAIMQEGQRRAFAGLSQPSPAKVERQAERPAAVQVNAVAVGLAKQAVSKFKALAAERRVGSPAMKDRGSKWQSLAPELREQIERFNALPATQQAQAAERMQQEMAERYSRDPKAAARDRELFQGRDRGGLSR
ncbi:Ti-type conjugative transfer relaxase TraA, partial [Klebsiella pneumoniae]